MSIKIELVRKKVLTTIYCYYELLTKTCNFSKKNLKSNKRGVPNKTMLIGKKFQI